MSILEKVTSQCNGIKDEGFTISWIEDNVQYSDNKVSEIVVRKIIQRLTEKTNDPILIVNNKTGESVFRNACDLWTLLYNEGKKEDLERTINALQEELSAINQKINKLIVADKEPNFSKWDSIMMQDTNVQDTNVQDTNVQDIYTQELKTLSEKSPYPTKDLSGKGKKSTEFQTTNT